MSAPLVFVHGWGLTSQVWVPFLPHLHHSAPLCLNLPGHAAAAAANDSQEAWVAALAEQLPPACTLVGWSLGAQLALALAVAAPAKVARLVLIAATPRFTASDDGFPGLPAATLNAFRADFANDPAAIQRRFVALQSLGDAARRAVANGLGEALAPIDGPTQRHALAAGLALLADIDLRSLATRIEQPVLLLHGSEDKLMPVAAAEWLATHLPHARLEVFPNCGHAPFLSRPTECAALIESFTLD